MKRITAGGQFLRDLKRADRRGKNLAKIEAVIESLAAGKALAAKHRPHLLKGELKGLWECHIEPDWLLIWDDKGDEIVLTRCGSHSDLFG